MAARVIGAVVLNRKAPAGMQHGCHGDVSQRISRRLRMGDSGFSSFKTTEDKTNRVLRDIEEAYGWPKERRNQSYAALRAVLHAVRDRLTVEETAQLGAQLPMLVRGIYYAEWDPSKVPMKQNRHEFMRRIRDQFPYQIEGDIEQLECTVLQALRRYISDGEWGDIKSAMPKDLAAALP
jgi:uncharacterized protein (DUF2267 family)